MHRKQERGIQLISLLLAASAKVPGEDYTLLSTSPARKKEFHTQLCVMS